MGNVENENPSISVIKLFYYRYSILTNQLVPSFMAIVGIRYGSIDSLVYPETTLSPQLVELS